MPVLLNPLSPPLVNGGAVINGGALNYGERPYRLKYKVKAATKIWQDSLVMLSNGGYAEGAYDAPGVAVGIADETVDNLSGASGAKDVTVRRWGILNANKTYEGIYFTPDNGPFTYDNVAGGMPEDNLTYYALIAATGTAADALTAVGRNHVTGNKIYAGHVIRVADTNDSNFNVKLWFDADIASIFADFTSDDGCTMVNVGRVGNGYLHDRATLEQAFLDSMNGRRTTKHVNGATALGLDEIRGRYISLVADAAGTLTLAAPSSGEPGIVLELVYETATNGAVTLASADLINGSANDAGAFLTARYKWVRLRWTGGTWIRVGNG